MYEFSSRSTSGLLRSISRAIGIASLLLVSGLVIVPLSHVSASASPITLTSPNEQFGGSFGTSVAIDGDTIVVGASGETVDGFVGAGAAYVFNATTGALMRNLTSIIPQGGGDFGTSVGIDGSFIVVGADNELASGSSGAGNVYAFNAKTGNLQAAFASPAANAQPNGGFGQDVDVSGDIVVASADGEMSGGSVNAGNAYVENATTGSLITSVTSPNSQDQGGFGYAIGLSGDVFVVGAPGELSEGNSGGGNVYVFDAATGGGPVNTPASPSPGGSASFGQSVATNGKIVVAGAYGEYIDGNLAAGAAYVFNAKNGAHIASLASPNEAKGGDFGWSVAVSNSTIVVGAIGEDTGGVNKAGAAYVFNATTDSLISTLDSPNNQVSGTFGFDVATSGNFVVVGAPGETVDGHQLAGHVYVYNTAASSSTSPVPEFPIQSLVGVLGITIAVVAVLLPKYQKAARTTVPQTLA